MNFSRSTDGFYFAVLLRKFRFQAVLAGFSRCCLWACSMQCTFSFWFMFQIHFCCMINDIHLYLAFAETLGGLGISARSVIVWGRWNLFQRYFRVLITVKSPSLKDTMRQKKTESCKSKPEPWSLALCDLFYACSGFTTTSLEFAAQMFGCEKFVQHFLCSQSI